MDEMTTGEELTTKEAAKLAGVSPRSIREWHEQEKITGRKTSAGLLIERRSLAEHLRTRGGTSAASAAPSIDITPLVRALAESQRQLGRAENRLAARNRYINVLEAEIAQRDAKILQLEAGPAEPPPPPAEQAAEPPPVVAEAAEEAPPWWARLRRWWARGGY